MIDQNGLSVGGSNLIKRDGDAIHIGENFLITEEDDGIQKLYAQDKDGNAIEIVDTLRTKGITSKDMLEDLIDMNKSFINSAK